MTVISAGLVVSNNQYCFLEPSFTSEPKDELLYDFDLIRGDNATIGLDSMSEKHSWRNTFGFVAKTHAEQRALANFFCVGPNPRMGKVRSFWMPSWISDFQLASNIQFVTDNAFFVKVPLYFDKMFEANRYGIQFELTNNDLVIHKIHAYDENSGQISIAPSTQIGKVINVADVSRLSLVRRVRFDQDRLSFKFRTDGVAETTVQVVEVFEEGVFA